MENRVESVQSTQLYLQASNIFMSTLPLQQQIQICHTELTLLSKLEDTTQRKMARMRDLNDEIWGCRIEIQSLRLKAHRLVKKARYLRFGDMSKPIESASDDLVNAL